MIGGIIAGVVLLLIICVIIYMARRRKNDNAEHEPNESHTSSSWLTADDDESKKEPLYLMRSNEYGNMSQIESPKDGEVVYNSPSAFESSTIVYGSLPDNNQTINN